MFNIGHMIDGSGMIYLILGLLFILFIWGVIFILRGLQVKAEEEKAIPISDLKEIKGLSHGPEEGLSPLPTSNPVAQHLVDENLKKKPPQEHSQLSENEIVFLKGKLVQQIKESKEEIAELKAENTRLNDALTRELDSKELARLSEEERRELKAKEELVGKIQQSLEELTGENHRFKKQLEENKGKITQLEQQVVMMQKEKDALLTELQKINQLSLEKENLAEQLRISQNQIKELEAQLNLLQSMHNQKLQQTETDMESFKSQESQRLKVQLEVELNKLKDFNAHLLDKETLLQYELTKSRAQAIGLERICEDFKEQIERLSPPLSGTTKR